MTCSLPGCPWGIRHFPSAAQSKFTQQYGAETPLSAHNWASATARHRLVRVVEIGPRTGCRRLAPKLTCQSR